ncbi:MAG: PdxA family protein [bacterium]
MNILITAGDVAGCSPALAAALIEDRKPEETLTFVGPASLRGFLLDRLGAHRLGSGVEWVEVGQVEREQIFSAQPTETTGENANRSLQRALELCQPGENSLLTLPLSKAVVQSAGYDDFVGHTERLEAFFDTDGVMTFFGDTMNVTLLTRHCPVDGISEVLNQNLVERTVRQVNEFYEKTYDGDFKFALLGLNPHAGEDGRIGTEDQTVLAPAVSTLRSDGIPIDGPHPADSFVPVHGGDVNLIFACYHDQGLVAFKQNHFFDGVHATLGLPIRRVSPDHGVALEGVKNGTVNPESALNCLQWLRDYR